MQRFHLDQFAALAEQDPAVVARITGILRDAAAGRMQQDDYAADLWRQPSAMPDDIRGGMKPLGRLQSLVIVEQDEQPERRSYRCLVEFEHARVLGYYAWNARNEITDLRSELAERKPPPVRNNS